MTKTAIQIGHVDEVLSQHIGSFTKLEKVAAPFTAIVGRALVTNFAKDCLPRFGIERVAFGAVEEVQGEVGAAGQRVYKPINDIHDAVRFVGVWNSLNGTYGPIINAPNSVTSDFIEITFYGTGVNLLSTPDSSSTLGISVDGGGVTNIPLTANSTIAARNYNANVVYSFSACNGLALGFHTVKISGAGVGNAIALSGYEILNTTASLQLPPGTSYTGGKKLSKAALSTDTYNSNFESGTLGTRGGHVVVYQKADGSIGKAVQPTDGTSLTLGSTSHANESVIRSYSWREFGAGRSDDFSTLATSTRGAAFTLDDGTTTLAGDAVNTINYNSTDGMRCAGQNNFIAFTFVGTGLDILVDTDGNGTRTFSLVVDGAVLTGVVPSINGPQVMKVVSGLPYGTHTVKMISTNNSASAPAVLRYIVYGPTKPTIPTGAVELADYYVMADYAVSTSSTPYFVSTGVLRKASIRELIYSGTWNAIGFDTSLFSTGWETDTSTATSYSTYSFFGTGCEFRGYVGNTHVVNATFTIDGLALNTGTNTGSTSSLVTTGITGLSLSAAGALTGTVSGAGETIVRISGLPLGLHTFKYLQNGTSVSPRITALDIITPIHSHKFNVPGDIQDTLPVGSQGVGDSRKFSDQSVKTLANWTQALGVSTSGSTNATAFIPCPDMTCIVKTTGNPIELFYSVEWFYSAIGGQAGFQVYIDGAAVGVGKFPQAYAASADVVTSDSFIVPVAAGTHVVQLFWYAASGAGANSVSLAGARRNLKVREI